MVRKLSAGAIMSIIALALYQAQPASAHFLGKDSVDGREIRYEKYTGYNTVFAWGVDHWNNLGKINIAPDTSSTIADLEIRDTWQTSVAWDGLWTSRSGADLIQFNRSYMDGYTDWQRRSISSHEFGHALGLGHSYDPNLMGSMTSTRKSSVPYTHDKADYNALWG